ncbi:hypothetical protein B5F36_10120 [Anaerofilum sp. An201]|nr:hypothetical protein B5F36_10120 [Anaerofilum sp. An201]
MRPPAGPGLRTSRPAAGAVPRPRGPAPPERPGPAARPSAVRRRFSASLPAFYCIPETGCTARGRPG